METFTYKNLTVSIYHDEEVESPREWGSLGSLICWHRRHKLGDDHSYEDSKDMLRELVANCGLAEQAPELLTRLFKAIVSTNEGREAYREYRNYFWEQRRADDFRMTFAEEYVRDSYGDLSDEAMQVLQEIVEEQYIVLPLYLYDHSGLRMNTTGFSCPWDSGQVGYAIMSIRKLEAEFGCGRQDAVYVNGKMVSPMLLEYGRDLLVLEVENYDNYLSGEYYYYTAEDDNGEIVDSCGSLAGYDYAVEYAKSSIDHLLTNSK